MKGVYIYVRYHSYLVCFHRNQDRDRDRNTYYTVQHLRKLMSIITLGKDEEKNRRMSAGAFVDAAGRGDPGGGKAVPAGPVSDRLPGARGNPFPAVPGGKGAAGLDPIRLRRRGEV